MKRLPSRCASAIQIVRPLKSTAEARCVLRQSIAQEISVFVKCRASNSLESTMKTNPITQDSGWDFSFWFTVSSPVLGVLLAILALAIFCR